MRIILHKFLAISAIIVFSLGTMKSDGCLVSSKIKANPTKSAILVEQILDDELKLNRNAEKSDNEDENNFIIHFPNIFDVLRSIF